jgi:hypothetical protein
MEDNLKLLEQEIKEKEMELEMLNNNSVYPPDSLEHSIFLKGLLVFEKEIGELKSKLNRKKEETCEKNGGHFVYITGYGSYSDGHTSYSEANTICLFCGQMNDYRARQGYISVDSIDYVRELEDYSSLAAWRVLRKKVEDGISEGKNKQDIIKEIKKNRNIILKEIKTNIKNNQLTKK